MEDYNEEDLVSAEDMLPTILAAEPKALLLSEDMLNAIEPFLRENSASPLELALAAVKLYRRCMSAGGGEPWERTMMGMMFSVEAERVLSERSVN